MEATAESVGAPQDSDACLNKYFLIHCALPETLDDFLELAEQMSLASIVKSKSGEHHEEHHDEQRVHAEQCKSGRHHEVHHDEHHEHAEHDDLKKNIVLALVHCALVHLCMQWCIALWHWCIAHCIAGMCIVHCALCVGALCIALCIVHCASHRCTGALCMVRCIAANGAGMTSMASITRAL